LRWGNPHRASEMRGHEGCVRALAVRGDRLFSAGGDGMIREWALGAWQLLRTVRVYGADEGLYLSSLAVRGGELLSGSSRTNFTRKEQAARALQGAQDGTPEVGAGLRAINLLKCFRMSSVLSVLLPLPLPLPLPLLLLLGHSYSFYPEGRTAQAPVASASPCPSALSARECGGNPARPPPDPARCAPPQLCVWDLDSLECLRRIAHPNVCAILPVGGCVWTLEDWCGSRLRVWGRRAPAEPAADAEEPAGGGGGGGG
jgi:hypothetical protein